MHVVIIGLDVRERGRADKRLCPDTNRRSLQRDLKAMIQKGIVLEKATSPTDPTKSYVLGGPG